MLVAPKEKDPIVLSYLALRKAVGVIAFGLPFALAVPWCVIQGRIVIEGSISGYYYSDMRNILVGSLCAIAMFLFGCRGYDRKDEIAGTFSALCALGIAFFPTAPDRGATPQQLRIGTAHSIFAGLLFLTLAYFCLVLFKMTAQNKQVTRKKLQRNRVYTVCGYVILVAIVLMGLFKLLHALNVVAAEDQAVKLHTTFWIESAALLAFGVAWLVKGETFLKDEDREPSRTSESP